MLSQFTVKMDASSFIDTEEILEVEIAFFAILSGVFNDQLHVQMVSPLPLKAERYSASALLFEDKGMFKVPFSPGAIEGSFPMPLCNTFSAVPLLNEMIFQAYLH